MSSDEVSALSASTEDLAVAFAEMRHHMLAEWTFRVKTEIPAAADLGEPILIDSFPVLYDDIAEAVCPEQPRPFATVKSNVAKAHGRERAKTTMYSLCDLVHEIQLFRQALFWAISARGVHVGQFETEIIEHAIEVATLESISSYLLVTAQVNETFVAGLSHDLRNPLHIANAAAQLICLNASDPVLVDLAKRICAKIKEIDSMIQTLLDAAVSKERMKLTLNLSNFDIMKVVDEVRGDMPLLGKPINVLGESIVGYWCRVSMQRLLENLVSNAQKYGDPRGVVTVRVQRFNECMLLSVHNDGQPIPEQDIPRLFQAFKRMDNTGIKGWGLGLPFVRNVAESHGGSVLAHSAEGQGTTFTVCIPVDARPYVEA